MAHIEHIATVLLLQDGTNEWLKASEGLKHLPAGMFSTAEPITG